MNRQSIYQFLAVLHVVLMVSSMMGGYAFVTPAAASTQQSISDDDIDIDVPSENQPAEQQSTAPPESTEQQSVSDSSVQNGLGDSSTFAQISESEPVSVPAYLDSHTIEDFSQQRKGNGTYNVSGVLNAEPVRPVVPFAYPVNVEILVLEDNPSGKTLVAKDTQNIRLQAGSAHPNKLELDYDNGTTTIAPLNFTDRNTTNPRQMGVEYDSATDQYYVVNDNGNPVKDASGSVITNESNFNISAVRDSYSADFGFNLQLAKENQDYEYHIFVSGNESNLKSTNYLSGTDPRDVLSQSTLTRDVTTGTPAATRTGVSSYFSVQTDERYTEERDVTFVTSYKSTLEQENKNIYEEIGLPIRGDYRNIGIPPQGKIKGFAKATATNNDFATVTSNSEGDLRLTTSTQTVPQNDPQTLVIRYVAPGDSNVTAIPIDSDGVPIQAGENSGQDIEDLGYVLPEDPTTVPYAVGKDNKTNVAVIQLTKDEQEQLNRYGELFLSFEATDMSDDFRLYCQSTLTGTVDRDVDACGINATQVDNYSNGVITNMTIHLGSTADFDGRITDGQSKIIGLDPTLSPSNPSGQVYTEVTVKNTGTRPIEGETVNIFKNAETVSGSTQITDSEVTFNKQDEVTKSSFSSYPTTETFALSDSFRGKDVTMRTDMNTGDGTIIITVTDGSGNSEKFVYDGHRGEISERLDELGPSSDWTVEVDTELITGQREPEVNSIQIEGKAVGSASTFQQTVDLDPGESKTLRFPETGRDIPTLNTELSNRIVYLGQFYDDTDSVEVQTTIDNKLDDCDNDGIPNVDDPTDGCDDLQSPEAIIDGPNSLQRFISGTENYRSGTRTIESTTCPGSTTESCDAGSEWDLVQEDVGTASGTKVYETTETNVPINLQLLGSGTYQNNIEPLTLAGVSDPYRNLPGDSSDFTHQSYTVVEATNTETIQSSRQNLIDRYGSYDAAQEAGWVVKEPNVATETVGTEYRWFRFIEEDEALEFESGERVDKISPEYSRVTEEEYNLESYSVPLTKTRTVAVETKIQQNDPDEDEFDNNDDWTQTERVEYVVDRYTETEYTNADGTIDDTKVTYETFNSNPGGEWIIESCAIYECTYYRPDVENEYWVYEWSKLQEREFRLHEKPVTEQQNVYTRTLYETDVSWETSMSGALNKYEGPDISQRNEYSNAQGTYFGDRSAPSENADRIIDYQWYINGNPVDRSVNSASYETTETIVPSITVYYSNLLGSDFSSFSEKREYQLPESDVQYQPREITLDNSVEYKGSGSISVKVINDYGTEKRVIKTGNEINGNLTLNLGDIGFQRYSQNYTVYYNGSAGPDQTPTIIEESTISANAERGSESLELDRSASGQVTLGLKVTDNLGYTDHTRKEIDINRCLTRDCTRNSDNPYIIEREHTAKVDYVGGVASVTAEVGGIDNYDDGFFVVELSPGDISPSEAANNVCLEEEEEMTAEEIKSDYNSWSGLDEEQVVSSDDPYCVFIDDSGVSNTVTVSESNDAEVGTLKRVVWEGSMVSGSSDTISFNINPRNNNLINVGENNFELTLRNVGDGEVVDRTTFDVFYCHALNNDPSTQEIPPEDRQTRAEGGLLCPGLNSDFDNFDDGSTAYDGEDACPYMPSRQEWFFTFSDGTGSCDTTGADGSVAATWSNFSRDQADVEATKHVVYYNRYDAVGAEDFPDGSSDGTLQLGYSPLEQEAFENQYLQAYYPLSEPSWNFTTVAPLEDEPAAVLIGWNAYQFQEDEYYLDISPGDSLVTSVPAWSLEQELNTNDIDDGSYPYTNYWFATDLSGNSNHAPIFHSETRTAVEGGLKIPGIFGTFGREYQDLYRGDERKVPERNKAGVYGSRAYRMNGQSYFVPFKYDAPWFTDKYNKPLEYPCEDSSCSAFHPRLTKEDHPLNGPGWNQDIADDITASDEFTVSMYVKPGPNSDQIDNRQALFAFHHWNGYPFGLLKNGEQTKHFASFHSDKFFTIAFKDYNTYSFRYSGNSPGRTSYGQIQYDSHGFINLPDRVMDADNQPLVPTLSGSTFLDTDKDIKRLLIQSMGHSSEINHVPPEMKSLRVNDGGVLEGTNDYGTGYRHFVVSVDQGEDVTYYIDGLPYRAQLLRWVGFDIGTLFSRDSTFPGFDAFRGSRGLMHLVGTEMNKGSINNYLRDYYISDYRLYSTAMSQSQVDDHLTIDSGTYESYTIDMYSDYSIERMSLPNCNTGCNKQDIIEQRLDIAEKEDMNIAVDGDLNGGAVTVTAYPLDNSGNRMSGGSEYLRVTHNDTQSVEYPYWFDGEKGNTSVGIQAPLELLEGNTPYETETDCRNYKVTCYQPGEVSGYDNLEIDKYYPAFRNPVAPFVGNEILLALDNGSISASSAYSLAQHYDDNQYYIKDKREFWKAPLYYSAGEEITIESYGISSQADFEDKIGYTNGIQTKEENELDAVNSDYHEWEIVVEIESRPHSQTSPQIETISVTDAQDSGSIDDCSGSIYRGCE